MMPSEKFSATVSTAALATPSSSKCSVSRPTIMETAVRAAALGLTLQSSEDSVEKLAREGFDPAYGARPLRRAIRSRVEDAIAEQLLSGAAQAGDVLELKFGERTVRIEVLEVADNVGKAGAAALYRELDRE